ncbi:uncharacterized protein LOC118279079 [Spodoptera frugiperda]|uniref:Uncharacterized protein LOC118279079 n=1 Tax=Spodoptera frugiperda TaxID=7108 RepID=A0A9R0F031_SPOFR|nr:uncharacterized protein LOC118279079 [Spodoptera frugiperda]
MRLLHSYEIFYHRSGVRKRVKNRWITDAIYLPDAQYLMMSASDRSLTVYDAATLSHTPLYCITGLPSIPTCMAYTPSSRSCDTSELAFGTERGDITLMRFLQPKLQLFHTKTPDAINYYFWMELPSPPHTSYCSITRWRKVHSRSVKRVAYSRGGIILVSCSHDATASVRIRHVPGKMDDYVFKVIRGVTCFHIVSALHLVATGGCDGSVRLWQPCGRAPFATLAAPTSPAILDLAIIAAHELIIAFCNNCTLYIWDLYEECLLQTIKIKFPFLGVLGKKVEFGPYCIHPGPVRKEKEEEEESMIEEPIVLSRRASSVYQGSTGGLMLQLDMENEWDKKGLEDEPEYKRFNRCEIMVSCCDFVCTVRLTDVMGAVVPPPADTLRARRPSVWDLPDYPATSTSSTTPRLRPSLAPTPQLLSPSTAEFPLTDLDTLLENAGLQGILEKDFVLMQGLKNDLNKKLAEMEANKQVMTNAVSAGAPYLALKTYDPSLVEPVDEMLDEYRRVMKLFPSTSITGTPTGSEKSTPRRSRSQKL